MALGKRNTQTQVKHLILSSYMDAWAGIIVNGLAKTAQDRLSRGQAFSVRLFYVDGFSHKGRYSGDAADLLGGQPSDRPTWGSPILGVQALDRAQEFALRTHHFRLNPVAVLIERNHRDFQDLQASLGLAGLSSRVAFNPTDLTLASGGIAAIHGDFHDFQDALLRLASGSFTWSFVLLDPYGPTGIPYPLVSRWISQARADVMINFPYQDLHKKQGILHRERRIPAEEALLRNYDAMFGTDSWRERCRSAYEAAEPAERSYRIEDELATFYLERLRAADPAVVVKHIRLQFPDRDRTMFYLFLTTHDPSGALQLNEVLSQAELSQYERKWHAQQARWVQRSHQAGQQTLFDAGLSIAPPPPTQARRVNRQALADYIWHEFKGQATTKKEIYRALANSDVFASEINQALTALKRNGRVAYDANLRLNDRIQFTGEGGSP